MSYGDDLFSVARLEKLRLIALVFAVGCSVAAAVLDLHWLEWPRAFGWLAAAVFAWLEARALKRLGRDGDGALLRAVLLAMVSVGCFVYAVKG